MNNIIYRPIGVIRTPYSECAPFQAREDDPKGPFVLEVLPEYRSALADLDSFRYIFVLFHMDRVRGYDGSNMAHPTGPDGIKVGLFASRSPNRPNPIGIDIVKILGIESGKVFTSGLSALDGTPLLDIKPYGEMDVKHDAGRGWAEKLRLPCFSERVRNIEFR